MEGLHPSSYQLNENWGFQINFMVPLDKSGYKQCKEIAKRQEEKLRLDYELVRALKCAELQTKGFTLRPGSRVEHMCTTLFPFNLYYHLNQKKINGTYLGKNIHRKVNRKRTWLLLLENEN